MDGSSRAFGIGPRIRLCGKDYTVKAKTVECYAEVEAHIRTMRGDPASMLAARAMSFSQLNVSPFLDKLQNLLIEKAKREKWPEDAFHKGKALLDEAKSRIDTTGQYEDVMRRAFDEARDWAMVTLWDVHKFLDETWQGQCMKVWFAIRDNDFVLTIERVTKMYYDELMDRTRNGGEEAAIAFRQEFEMAVAIAEGNDVLGNSTGSNPAKPATEASQKDVQTAGT